MKLIIFDGNSIINRAFYALPPLTNSRGRYTNALYGFLNIYLKFLENEKPDFVTVAFDLPGGTFRNKLYDGYKSKRKGMPDELAEQLPVLKDILTAMNVKFLELAGYEADDIIGTVSRICDEENIACDIVTGDRDDLQLASENTNILLVTTSRGKTDTVRYTPDTIKEKYSLSVSQLIDLKALMGDSSDNIPGVAGIGEKTATALLQKYGSLDAIYSDGAIENERATVKAKLEAGRDMAYLSRTLGTIERRVPIEFTPADFKLSEYNEGALFRLLDELELKTFIERFSLSGETAQTPPMEVEILPFDDEAAEKIRADGVMYYALANNSALILSNGRVYEADLPDLSGMFADENIKKRAFDIKRDMTQLHARGESLAGEDFDFMIAGYVIDPAMAQGGLSHITARMLPDINLGNAQSREGLAAAVFNMARLYEKMHKKIIENNQEYLFYSIEMPLVRVLFDTEREGMYVDEEILRAIGEELASGIKEVQKEIYELAGEEFNIGSPKQLGVILFERMGLPVVKKTKTGYSTDAAVLEKLKPHSPIIEKILRYRQMTKLSSTYVEGLLSARDERGYIHTLFNQALTLTGRLSSAEPNLQNIPIRMPEGRRIRRAFICEREGYEYVCADYSQIELRVLAGMSADETMTKIFCGGGDIHAATAAEVWGVSPDDVTPALRSRAKAVNFGIVYGISAFTLAGDIGASMHDAKLYIDNYFKTFSGVKKYLDDNVARASEEGFVRTKFNRIRYIPELKNKNKNIRSFGERVALNTPIQGTAADIIKLAMVNVHRALKEAGLKTKMVLQVHDELVLLSPSDETERAGEILVREMEQVCDIGVPLKVSLSRGKSWYDAK